MGGLENISTQERALIEEAVLTKLILSSMNVWLLAQPSLVSGRNRGVLPAVLHSNQLVTTLKVLLDSLGLKRRAKPVELLEDYLKRRAPSSREGENGDGEGS